MDIVTLLVALLVVGLVVWFAFWLVDSSGIPTPFSWFIKGIVLIVGLLWLFNGGGNLPNINL